MKITGDDLQHQMDIDQLNYDPFHPKGVRLGVWKGLRLLVQQEIAMWLLFAFMRIAPTYLIRTYLKDPEDIERLAEIAAIPDKEIDYSEIPEADEDWFKRAKLRKRDSK